MTGVPCVDELVIYPIKSCSGIRLSQILLTKTGLQGDRVYMLVDEEGRFVTGRTEPRLVMVNLHQRRDQIVAATEGKDELVLPAEPVPRQGAPPLDATIWRDTVKVFSHPEGSTWFSSLLNRKLHLVFLDPSAPRTISGIGGSEGDLVSLADGYPVLLCNASSLDDLNQRLETPVPMSRFRPNIVLAGALAFDEDTYAELALGGVSFVAPKLCDRCVFTTVDAKTGTKGKEPLKTLSRYRKWDGAVWFGANLIPRKEGLLRVGDTLTVINRGPHPRADG